MDKFEIDSKKIKRDLIDLGIGKEKADEMLKIIYGSYDLDNDFPKLSHEDEKKVKSLGNKRNNLINEYKRIAWLLQPLIEEEAKVWDELENISDQICNIQGHRLSSNAVPLIDYDHGLKFGGYARTCVICGNVIKKEDFTSDDVVVADKISYPKKVHYKK